MQTMKKPAYTPEQQAKIDAARAAARANDPFSKPVWTFNVRSPRNRRRTDGGMSAAAFAATLGTR